MFLLNHNSICYIFAIQLLFTFFVFFSPCSWLMSCSVTFYKVIISFQLIFLLENNMIILFYQQPEIFDELFTSLNFLFLLSYCHICSTLFKTNSRQLIFELIKTLEIKISILFNLDLANYTILSCFFSSSIDW